MRTPSKLVNIYQELNLMVFSKNSDKLKLYDIDHQSARNRSTGSLPIAAPH
jgi:hypothetical protein